METRVWAHPSSTGQRITPQPCHHATREKPSFLLSFFTAWVAGTSVRCCWAQVRSYLLAGLDVSILDLSALFSPNLGACCASAVGAGSKKSKEVGGEPASFLMDEGITVRNADATSSEMFSALPGTIQHWSCKGNPKACFMVRAAMKRKASHGKLDVSPRKSPAPEIRVSERSLGMGESGARKQAVSRKAQGISTGGNQVLQGGKRLSAHTKQPLENRQASRLLCFSKCRSCWRW